MQMMAVEFARNVLRLKDANSTEFDENTTNPLIHIMEDQKYISGMGGTMRLGSYECELIEDSLAYKLYDSKHIKERHRHRYELNQKYVPYLKEAGLHVTGFNPIYLLPEIVELENHPFFIGCQFHPEFKSRPEKPHPLFTGLIEAAKKGGIN
jgi:CTP synthase